MPPATAALIGADGVRWELYRAQMEVRAAVAAAVRDSSDLLAWEAYVALTRDGADESPLNEDEARRLTALMRGNVCGFSMAIAEAFRRGLALAAREYSDLPRAKRAWQLIMAVR